MEQWAEIRRLHRSEGVPIQGDRAGWWLGRNTVRAALAADEPPGHVGGRRGQLWMCSSRRSGRCWPSIRQCLRR